MGDPERSAANGRGEEANGITFGIRGLPSYGEIDGELFHLKQLYIHYVSVALELPVCSF